jgi:hypothetical protein
VSAKPGAGQWTSLLPGMTVVVLRYGVIYGKHVIYAKNVIYAGEVI